MVATEARTGCKRVVHTLLECFLAGLLPPANKVCEGYVFTRVCHSVHRAGECLLPVWGGCLLPGGCLVETPHDGYCCGRYASYWNAFLFIQLSVRMLFLFIPFTDKQGLFILFNDTIIEWSLFLVNSSCLQGEEEENEDRRGSRYGRRRRKWSGRRQRQ